MRSLLTSRLFRSVVCLLLICCVLAQISPLRVNATAVAPAIVKGATVTGNPWIIVGAILIALGIQKGVESGAFETVVDNAVSFLDTAGGWIENGTMQLLQTVDSTGQAMYYAAGDLLDSLRDWLFSSGVLYADLFDDSILNSAWKRMFSVAVTYPYAFIAEYYNSYGSKFYKLGYSEFPIYFYPNQIKCSGKVFDCTNLYSNSNLSWDTYNSYEANLPDPWTYKLIGYSNSISANSSYDLTLGYLPSQDMELDDTTVVTFHPYLANVIKTRTGGSGGSGDEPENKWWLSLAFAESLDKLYETTQQFQIETPSVTEIPDIQVGIEYDITEEEDEDGDKYFVLDPVTTPGTGTDPGTGTNPDTGDGSGDNTGSDTGTTPGTGTATKPSSFFLDLRNYFPFCIPFDIGRFLKALIAPPVAPVFHWEVQDLSGNVYEVDVDLSPWDPHAALFRDVELALFIVGLALITRKLIKW